MKILKKLPLFITVLLMVIWGASKKINIQEAPSFSTSTITSLSVDNLEKLSKLTYKTRAEFYAIIRPQLSSLITDRELLFIYDFLQKEDVEVMQVRKDKLEALLVLFTMKPS